MPWPGGTGPSPRRPIFFTRTSSRRPMPRSPASCGNGGKACQTCATTGRRFHQRLPGYRQSPAAFTMPPERPLQLFYGPLTRTPSTALKEPGGALRPEALRAKERPDGGPRCHRHGQYRLSLRAAGMRRRPGLPAPRGLSTVASRGPRPSARPSSPRPGTTSGPTPTASSCFIPRPPLPWRCRRRP